MSQGGPPYTRNLYIKLFMAVLDCICINQNHKVRIYKEYHSRNWDSPNPSLASECAPQPSTGTAVPGGGGGGAQSPAGEGLGKSQFRRLEKSVALCLLCDQNPYRLRVINPAKNTSMHKLNNKYFPNQIAYLCLSSPG
jgi:hypothetical protein